MEKLNADDLNLVQELKEILGWHWPSCGVEKKQLEEIQKLIKFPFKSSHYQKILKLNPHFHQFKAYKSKINSINLILLLNN